ncbi:hypothetical protein SCA6_004265 [Theobroma cacao]
MEPTNGGEIQIISLSITACSLHESIDNFTKRIKEFDTPPNSSTSDAKDKDSPFFFYSALQI